MDNNIDFPSSLIEHMKCKKIIDSIIDNWFENHKHLIETKEGNPTLNRSIITNCMIHYRNIMHGELIKS